jgi:hypothetical protein
MSNKPIYMTYDSYNEAVRWVNKQKKVRLKNRDGYIHTDSEPVVVVKRLMGQFYYGIEAKKELYYKLIEYGVIVA